MAQRIQRKRTKGWRMPAGAVYVGRPTKWGNPCRMGSHADQARNFRQLLMSGPLQWRELREQARRELAGKDLACWCPLNQPCHADVLLELANKGSMV
jgi:hypothetical protein